MNDAARGIIGGLCLVALFLALQLMVAYLWRWHKKKEHREHVVWHVLWMPIGLITTAVLLIWTLVDHAGHNMDLAWKDFLRLIQMSTITAGLKPVWDQHKRTAGARRERQVSKTVDEKVAEERA